MGRGCQSGAVNVLGRIMELILQLLLKSPNKRLLNVSDVGTSIF